MRDSRLLRGCSFFDPRGLASIRMCAWSCWSWRRVPDAFMCPSHYFFFFFLGSSNWSDWLGFDVAYPGPLFPEVGYLTEDPRRLPEPEASSRSEIIDEHLVLSTKANVADEYKNIFGGSDRQDSESPFSLPFFFFYFVPLGVSDFLIIT